MRACVFIYGKEYLIASLDTEIDSVSHCKLATAHGKFMVLKSLSGLTDGPHKCSVVTLQLRGIHQEIFFFPSPCVGSELSQKVSKRSSDNSRSFFGKDSI